MALIKKQIIVLTFVLVMLIIIAGVFSRYKGLNTLKVFEQKCITLTKKENLDLTAIKETLEEFKYERHASVVDKNITLEMYSPNKFPFVDFGPRCIVSIDTSTGKIIEIRYSPD